MSWLTPDLIDILLSILKAVVILLVVVTCGAFMSFGERRLLGLFQNRYGPNRVGWGGSLQLVADLNIGILFFLMMAGLAVYAVLFAGWSSNNKYSLLGAGSEGPG